MVRLMIQVAVILALAAAHARAEDCTYLQSGMASVYSKNLEGRRTASGAPLRMGDYTAAHPTLKSGTRVKVVDVKTGRATHVTINDKGPHVKRRVIDLTAAPADDLDFPVGRNGFTGVRRVKLYVCEN